MKGTGEPEPFTIPSQDIATFPTFLADVLASHLAQQIVFMRGIRTNYDDEYKAVLKEITVWSSKSSALKLKTF